MIRSSTLAALLCISLAPTAAFAEDETGWQAEKCAIFESNWAKALEFFGSDNLNYNFIAQNENFIASGCTENPSICPQSNQELDIANALTMAMMNAGTASTFLPYRCSTEVSQAPSNANVEAELCRSQLDLLQRGRKLTEDEAAVFEAQCACLETDATADCAQARS